MKHKKYRQKIISGLYRSVAKPALFTLNAETAHNLMTAFGEFLGRGAGRKIVSGLLRVKSPALYQKYWGIEFPNPIGLAAGFDYNGHLPAVMPHVGFGFNTVGTVTARAYEGNDRPRLTRLPKSRSILVNKGFKSDGAAVIARRLDKTHLKEGNIGLSIGSSNVPEVNNVDAAINDYLETFIIFRKKPYIKYFELNISCPNTSLTEVFLEPKNLEKLLRKVAELKIKQPVLIKMPGEISPEKADELIQLGLKYGHNGYIFSNLLKNRQKSSLNSADLIKIRQLKGNISGRPTFEPSNKLIKHARKKFGDKIIIVGCGGVFNASDAYAKLKAGANLVQLITGMIYQGPQLIGEINRGLLEIMQTKGYKSISEAVHTE